MNNFKQYFDTAVNNTYQNTNFKIDDSNLPERFVIISGLKPYRDKAADESLRIRLSKITQWYTRVTCYFNSTKEESWGASITEEQAKHIGRDFNQEAFFSIVGDNLYVVYCDSGDRQRLGNFRKKIIK